MRRERGDVIVVGGGLGGLVAAALAAKAGLKVLLLERHDQVGGAATLFSRQGIHIDAGLHQLDGLDGGDPKLPLLKELGLLDALTPIPLPEFYAVRHPDLGCFVMPAQVDQHRQVVIDAFPRFAHEIQRWFDTLGTLRQGIALAAGGGREISWDALKGIGALVRHERATLGGWLDRLFGDQEGIKLALGANLPYYGDDPHRLSLIYFAAAQASFYRGNHYLKGGSGRLSRALAEIVTTHGGEVHCGAWVHHIRLERGRVAGVAWTRRDGSSPREADAPRLFANANPLTVADMLPAPEGQRLREIYGGLEPSTSLWCLYLGVEGAPAEQGLIHHATFFLPPWMRTLGDYRQAAPLLASAPDPARLPPYVAANYGTVEAGLDNGDITLVTLTGLDRLAHWDGLDPGAYARKKTAWMEALLQDFSARHPGLGERIVMREMATARTMARYLNTPGGAVYGFAQTPRQAGRHRLGPATPVPGLWLASAFSMPGGGFTGAMLAGQRACAVALGKKGCILSP